MSSQPPQFILGTADYNFLVANFRSLSANCLDCTTIISLGILGSRHITLSRCRAGKVWQINAAMSSMPGFYC